MNRLCVVHLPLQTAPKCGLCGCDALIRLAMERLRPAFVLSCAHG